MQLLRSPVLSCEFSIALLFGEYLKETYKKHSGSQRWKTRALCTRWMKHLPIWDLESSRLLCLFMQDWGLSSSEESLLSTIVFVGMLVGAYAWGVVSDNYGRRRGFHGTAVLTSGAGFLITFSPNYILFLIFRFLVGIGLGSGSVFACWFLEFVPADNRGKWMVVFSSFWRFGTIFEAALAWIVMSRLSWRWLLAFSSLPSFVLLLFYSLAPESPKYLCAKELPGLLLSAILVDRIGRKLTFIIILTLAVIFLLPLAFYQSATLTTALLFGARMCAMGSITVAYIYGPEIYPTSVRTTGIGVAGAVGRIGGMICPLVAVGLVTSCHQTAAIILFEVVIVLSAICAFLFPFETKRQELIDTIVVSKSKEALVVGD